MKVTGGIRVSSTFSKSGWMSLVASAKEWKRDIEGSLSVISMPARMSVRFSKKGRSIMAAKVSEKEIPMKGVG